MKKKEDIVSYLQTQKWNSPELEGLIDYWDGSIEELREAASKGRVALMKLFFPGLKGDEHEVASDILCPLSRGSPPSSVLETPDMTPPYRDKNRTGAWEKTQHQKN